jgi:1-acyl-sn-glycerol-3-phosphate acyltransferase
VRRPGRSTQYVVPEVDFATVRASHAFWRPIVERYFRSTVRGMDRIPSEQCLVVQHHDGGLFPVNGICLGVAWHQHFAFERPLYVLAHDLIHRVFGMFTDLLPRSGLVPADREVVDAIAPTGHDILVFPGAARESFRPFWERDKIDLGGRTGFVRQALKHRLPIVPVVSAGSHETLIVLARGAKIAERLGLRNIVRSADSLPILAGLPWGIWVLPFLPQLPLPAKITSEVLEPIFLKGDPDDPVAVQVGFDRVLEHMQTALRTLYAERRWPILG